MIEFVPYEAHHAETMIAFETRPEEAWFVTADVRKKAKEKESGDAWTMLEDGMPKASGGFYRYDGNGAEAWFMICPSAKRYAKSLARFVTWAIDHELDTRVTSVYAAVLDHDMTGKKWAEFLKFESTGKTVDDIDGRTYAIYERRR